MTKAVALVGLQIPDYKVRIANPDQPPWAKLVHIRRSRVFTPDPSDALWPKWAGHAVLGTASSLVLYSAGKNILNPNLEGTTTSRGNPTDWSFDPEINRLQNDKYYPPGSKPPGWFWPAVGAAGAHELYQNWPKPNIPQHTQPVDNTYVSPRPIYPYGY